MTEPVQVAAVVERALLQEMRSQIERICLGDEDPGDTGLLDLLGPIDAVLDADPGGLLTRASGIDGRLYFGRGPRKDLASCCQAHRDDLGRLPIGYCSPGCLRRPRLTDTAEG